MVEERRHSQGNEERVECPKEKQLVQGKNEFQNR